MATNALALQQPRSGRAALYGTRAQLAAASGQVEGYLALAACDPRHGTASYALRVNNGSAQALRARMHCRLMRGGTVLAYPLDVQVAPFSQCDTLLPVRLDEVGPYDRAIVEINGGDVGFSLEAPAPHREARRFPWLRTALASTFAVVAVAFAAAVSTPHLILLDAPQRAFASRAIDVPYAFGGLASMEYSLRTSDGRRLAAGLVNDREGTLHFAVPASDAGKRVVLSATVAGLLGSISMAQPIDVAAAPLRRTGTVANALPQPPRIAEFAMTSPSVRAGADVTFRYTTNAPDGEIWLIDESGQLWGRSEITADGTTLMKLPAGTAGRQLRAVLHAKNGALDAVASVAFTVLPGDVVSTKTGDAAVAAPAAGVPNATLTLSTSATSPGETFTVTLSGAHGDTTIALNDASGNSLETGDIAGQQTSITMTAPSTAGTYFVTANVSQGVTTQTLVQKLIVSK